MQKNTKRNRQLGPRGWRSKVHTIVLDIAAKLAAKNFRACATAKTEWREAEGKALFIGDSNTGSLKVSFFGPFYGGYHVAALDPEYRWSLVIGPDPSYAWILARDKTLSAADKERILTVAKQASVDTAALIWVSQNQQDPAAR